MLGVESSGGAAASVCHRRRQSVTRATPLVLASNGPQRRSTALNGAQRRSTALSHGIHRLPVHVYLLARSLWFSSDPVL
eukprot:482562-Rhodomonas_salina.1